MSTPQEWSARRPIIVGGIAIVCLVLGLGFWGSFTKISGAVVSSGMIQGEALRQVVQHPDGGVVGAIMARDGDSVAAGDVLIRFDDTLLKSQISILEGQYIESAARLVRLRGERDGTAALAFDLPADPALGQTEKAQQIFAAQNSLFLARLDSYQQTRKQLVERKSQIGLQVGGAEAQLAALARQITLIGAERADQEDLLAKGLAQASRVLALQREEARLLGQRGELEASIATSQAQMIEIDIEVLRLASERRETAETDLQEINASQLQLSEQLFSARETLSRMEVRAPMAGIVHGMAVHARRSVVRAAEPILYIIPQNQPFIVQSRIEAVHVDQVYVGQGASLRFSTFDQRTTPEIFGTVRTISADVIEDERTGVPYYTAEITPNAGELVRLGDVELLPGMPVEAFLKTAERTPISYLTKPFTDYFNRAFREQ
ncbi:HlyD family type I secretion periplasmic adaptor subunit [Amylibacter marinus]|uniref:Membrane fusion protein (MFP) family protein n=1 Tax=Amylibacter marinus TaxID=1475483 RepID=A0ABQ5VWN5_9RHOB|nr:HlyD family type I secretion periplasmic adaptor subunit [Amylibacter marinus]GLQ35688.1 HlyD family type I secretion periplasmic adaptor subunit [Amylibacter marinus]